MTDNSNNERASQSSQFIAIVHGLLSFVVAVTVAAATLVGVELIFASRLRSLYSSPNPFANLITYTIWCLLAAIPIVGVLTVYTSLAKNRTGKSRLAVAVSLSITAVAVLVLAIGMFLGPYALAVSFPAIPAWIAGGVASSISMLRADNTSAGKFSRLPKLGPAVAGGAVAGALPIMVVMIASPLV